MKLSYFGPEDIQHAIDLDQLREELKIAFAHDAINAPRLVLPLGPGQAIGSMLAYSTDQKLLGAKVVTVFTDHSKRTENPHQGLVILFNLESGRPMAIFDASEITAYRTAALSAAATSMLAHPQAESLAIFGTGLQAYHHALAIARVRRLKRIHLYGRNQQAAQVLAEKIEMQLNVSTTFYTHPQEAAGKADILCLCTSSTVPYLQQSDVPGHAHINAIGACRPGMREMNLDNFDQIGLYADDLKRVKEEADELREALQQKTPITEIGEVFRAERKIGLASRSSGITFFKSVGVGLSDLVTARIVLTKINKEQGHYVD